jgi:hypothetical protein
MKIGTTIYNTGSTYNGKWTEISEKCDWVVATESNYSIASTGAPNATLLYRTFGGLSMTVPTSKDNTGWDDITSEMIFPDKDTSNDSEDTTTTSVHRYIMNLSNPAFITNKVAELDYIFANYPLFDGFIIDILPYEGLSAWNISTSSKTYYRQLVQAFLLQIQYEFSSKIIIPNCYPITSSPVGDYSLAKISSGEMATWSLDKSDANWTSLFSYITAVTAAVPTGLNKYFIVYFPTPSSMTVTAQNNADIFRLNGIKSTNLVLLTDMFG